MSSKYFKNSKYSVPKWNDKHIDFVAECITSMTNDEIAQAFYEYFGIEITPKVVQYFIDRFNLIQFCVPPNTNRPWELVKENKVQCAICGRWLKALHSHVKYKHAISLSEYKEKFGINDTQPLCSKELSILYQKQAPAKFTYDIEKLKERITQIRPYRYKKRKQAITDRIEKGIQSKAGKAPRRLRRMLEDKYLDYILHLKENEMSYNKIADIMSEKVKDKVTGKIIRTIILNAKKTEKGDINV